MLRQARELFALPTGDKKTTRETSTKQRNKKAKRVDKKSKSKVPKQIENDDSNKKLERKSATFGSIESMLQDRQEANTNHRKRQNHSSSSGGSSSGYLSQAVAFQSNENSSDQTTIDHVTFGTRNGAVGDKVANGQNGLHHSQPTHQSDRALNSTSRGMIDARFRQRQQPNGHHHFQHLRTPMMVPMMIDDDDDGQLAVEDLGDEDDDDNLDVRQMLASHRERLRGSEGDHRDHPQYNISHHGGLIDGLPAQATDDKLSHPTYVQRPRSLAQAQTLASMTPHHHQQHANSDDDTDNHAFNRQSFHRSEASVATLGRPHQHHYLDQDRPVLSYLYSGQQSLDQHLHSSRQQYLNRLVTGPQHQQHKEQPNAAAIYYQPNLIDSEHRHQKQRQQQERHNKTYERPSYLQASSSFLYHQPYATQQTASRRNHHQLGTAHKPVPPLPPSSHQKPSSGPFASANGQLNSTLHPHRQLEAGLKMMQTSGSRQHLTTSPEQQQYQHHNTSSGSSSPHSRRNNLKQGPHTGSSQLSIVKQNLRPVPNRSTPTPTHPTRPSGPTTSQMLPAGGLSGELPPPMSCCGKMAKFLLFIANALFWAGGIALGAWGILGLVDDHKYNLSQLLVFEPSTRMSLFQLLSWSFITLGCATILVGFCGCSAMFKNSRWILGLYIFLVLAIFALDLATGLLAIIFQERLVANVRLRLVHKLRTEYGIQASFTAAIDYIQTRYECCGLDGHLDYDQSLWRLQRLGGFEATVARTCCHLRNTFDDQAHVNPRPVNESMCQSTDIRFHQSYRYRKGCLDDLERLIRHKIWTFTIGCGAVGAIILLSMVFATCFCRSIPNTGSSRKSSAATATGSRVYHQQAAYLETTNPKKTKHSSYR